MANGLQAGARQFRKAARSLLFAASLAGMVGMGESAMAGPLADAAAQAEAQAAAGDAAGARVTMETAFGAFSAGLPMSISRATFVRAEPSGYAMYEPRGDSAFKPGESLISYIEPVGLSWAPAPEAGKLETRFTVDFDILDPKGTVLAGQKAFGDFRFVSYQRNQEIYATLTIDVTGAPPGAYVLRFRFNDAKSDKTASVEQPFTIVAPPETPPAEPPAAAPAEPAAQPPVQASPPATP
ncbi:hypothetical protein BJF92_04615 [Rhizobium rhizosphaerae]|uniref:Uncharacterized protein n=1 Tax=Xaviernesmea rhizosphaerae TaxID=1672749 RepID=A0A1Q9AFY7_9HYPH|nr:hypothetical protein [Xaviernesmea rhizosphaerae]OLP53871.1 hypothetical protein BJF92_04615 [Xaviernesmea rhizosphaerae]